MVDEAIDHIVGSVKSSVEVVNPEVVNPAESLDLSTKMRMVQHVVDEAALEASKIDSLLQQQIRSDVLTSVAVNADGTTEHALKSAAATAAEELREIMADLRELEREAALDAAR